MKGDGRGEGGGEKGDVSICVVFLKCRSVVGAFAAIFLLNQVQP